MFTVKLLKSKIIHSNSHFLASLGAFLILMLFSFGSLPYLDGNIDFVKNYDFFSGGFPKLFQNWNSVHPPIKMFITSLFFATFGVNRYSYTTIGIISGVIGIGFFYSLTSRLLGKKSGIIATSLLATNPLFLSVGIFSLTDYLLAVFSIGSFYFYLKRKYILLAIFLSLSFLSKETGILIPLSIIFVEGSFILIKRRAFAKNIKSFFAVSFSSLIPLLTAYLWYIFLKIKNKPLWSDWNFSDTASRGSVYTIFHNITSFSFLNKYTYQNWLHLFVLNFNWAYWLITLIGIFILIKTFLINKRNIFTSKQNVKTTLAMLVFFITYFFTVLSFQTYTIPRYTLPLIPILIIATSKSIEFITKQLKIKKTYLLAPIMTIACLSLFSSIDPVSIKIWGKEKLMGESLYALGDNLAGNDGITYNMQYALIAKKRTDEILSANTNKANAVLSEDCSWLFPDPNNDQKTMNILKLHINPKTPCSNIR